VKYLILLFSLIFFPAKAFAQAMYELPVAHVEFCPNSQFNCPDWSGYVRLGDTRGPIYFLISISGMGCEVDMMAAAKIDSEGRGQKWACVWRNRRYVN